MHDRARRVARLAPAIAQTALAAGLSWAVATHVVGHARPFFAPVAAIIALGVVLTERARRAAEIVVGVSVGVLVADVIAGALGRGPVQIALVTALAMIVAVAAGGGRVLIGQAATTAVLLAATVTAHPHLSLARPVDALVGGATALAVGLLILPMDPRTLVRRPAARLADGLGAGLDRIAAALAAGDHDAVLDALDATRALDTLVARYAEAVVVGRELCALSPLRRGARPVLERHVTAAEHLGYAVRNVQALARGSIRAVDLAAHVPAVELEALADLARAVRALPGDLEAADGGAAGPAVAAALHAAGLATLALEGTSNLSLSVLTGLLRSTATDVLRALGMRDGESAQAVRRAVMEITS